MTLFKPYQAILFVSFSLLIIGFSIPTQKDLGMYYFNSFEYDKAVTYLVKEGRVHSEDVFVLKKLKEYALIQGDVEKAFETQLQLLSLKPHNIEYLMEAEKLADWTGNPAKKLEIAEKRAELVREEDPLEYRKLLLKIAAGYGYLKDFKNADRLYKVLGEIGEQDSLEAAIRYFLARKDAPKAELYLSTYNDKYPNNFQFNTFYYQTLMYQGNFGHAFEVLVKTLYPGIHSEVGDEEFLKGLKLELTRTNAASFKRESGNFKKLIRLSYSLFDNAKEKMIQREDLLKIVDSMEGKLPGFGLEVLGVGVKAFNKGHLELYEHLIQLARRNTQEDFRDIHYELSEFFLAQKNYKEARHDLEALTERFPLNRKYWELLGDTYNALGEKKKAIEAFKKLYKLQKKKADQAFILKIPKENLFCDITLKKTPPLKRQKLSQEEKRLLSVEERLVDSIYSLDDRRERLVEFESFLKENPDSLSAKKGMAYTYFDLGNSEEALKIFREIYERDKLDLDANRALISDWIVNSEWEKVEEAMKIIPSKTSDYDEIFSEYYYEKEPKKYQTYCKSNISPGARMDCLYRQGKKAEALKLSQDLNQGAPTNCEFLVRRIYLETELGDSAWVTNQLNNKDERCLLPNQKEEISNFLYSQDLLRKSGEFWRYSQSFGFLKTDRFQLTDTEVSLMRKLRSWAIELGGNYWNVLTPGDAAFSFVTLGVTYFFRGGSALTVGPTYMFGDKNSKAGAFLRYFKNIKNTFFGLEGYSRKPLSFTRDLANEKTAYSAGLEAYGNHRTSDQHWVWTGIANLQDIHFLSEKSFFSQFTGEGLRRVYTNKKKKPLFLYTGLQVSNSNLSSAKPRIKENFLQKSLALHGVIKMEYNYPDNFMPRKWSGFLRFGFGGDLQRDIDFFKSLQATGRINKAISKRAKVFVGAEYYSEFLGVNRGSTEVYRLGITQDF